MKEKKRVTSEKVISIADNERIVGVKVSDTENKCGEDKEYLMVSL